MGPENLSGAFATLSVGPAAAAPPTPRFPSDVTVESDGETIFRKPGLEVFCGTISDTKQKVVVKRIFFKDMRHKAALDEARMLKSLDHPNVIKCILVIEQADYVDIVMEQGTSLANERKDKVFSAEEINRIINDLCEGLAYIHAQGIVHFDLKCDNIIMVDGRAKLADFGSSHYLVDSSQTLPAPRGTVPFMSPEMVRQEPLGTSADIWSLGATLYELVTGMAPFVGSEEAIMWQIGGKKSLPSLQASSEFADLISSCTQSDPERRPTAQRLLSRSSG